MAVLVPDVSKLGVMLETQKFNLSSATTATEAGRNDDFPNEEIPIEDFPNYNIPDSVSSRNVIMGRQSPGDHITSFLAPSSRCHDLTLVFKKITKH